MIKIPMARYLKFFAILSVLPIFIGVTPSFATDSAHQKFQKAELKQIFSILGTTTPCVAWAEPISANGYTWILVTLHSRINGNCSYRQGVSYKLIKEFNNQFTAIKLSDIGINDSRNISFADNGPILKVSVTGSANILWSNNGQPALTTINTNNTSKTVYLDKYGCSEGTARLDLIADDSVITWAPKHQNPDPNKSFCDALMQVFITDSNVEYIRTPWGDTPPDQYSADFLTGRLATTVAGSSIYTCAVRSYPVDQYKVAGPQYFGANFSITEISTRVSSMRLVSKSISESLNCALMFDKKSNEGVILVKSVAGNTSTSSLATYDIKDSNFNRPTTVGGLDCSGNENISFSYLVNQVNLSCTAGTKVLSYKKGILQAFGPGESLFTQSVDDNRGNTMFFDPALVSGQVDSNGPMRGFQLLYINYVDGISAIERGNIELFTWCDPKQASPDCKLGSKEYQRAIVSASWSGNSPTFYVVSVSGNELMLSKVVNTVLEAPAAPALQVEVGSSQEASLTAFVESDGRSPVLQFKWQRSTDKITWRDIQEAKTSELQVPANSLPSNVYYRAIAINSLGESMPSVSYEQKGMQVILKIKCVNKSKTKIVSGVNPVCPKGYRKK